MTAPDGTPTSVLLLQARTRITNLEHHIVILTTDNTRLRAELGRVYGQLAALAADLEQALTAELDGPVQGPARPPATFTLPEGLS